MTPRYSVRVDRIGTADYAAYVFRGSCCIADVRSYRRDFAVRDAVDSVRFLRHDGALRLVGGAL